MIQRNVLDWLEASASGFPDKIAFETEHESVTYSALLCRAREIGSFLSSETEPNKPVLILSDKGPDCICAMLGTVYAGCFYTPLDESMPEERLSRILSVLKPEIILTQSKYVRKISGIAGGAAVHIIAELPHRIEEERLARIRRNGTDTDILYVLFTSGSTGIPKGVAIAHRSVIDLAEWAVEKLRITEQTRFGNQAPLYFDNSVLEIYSSLCAGATVHFIGRRALLYPLMMPYYLNENRINTIFWVPSVYSMVLRSGAFEEELPRYLTSCFFCGEVMPVSTLNGWRKALPDAFYVNMYGPTEITDVCTYYIIDRAFAEGESLPIGRACENTRVKLIDGEICVSGSCLALGYYNDPEKTAEAFQPDPERPQVTERIYRTGDLGAWNDRGELMFLGRNDQQIKKKGNRIELGEIESAVSDASAVSKVCCLYDAEREQIVCFYAGAVQEKELKRYLKTRLQDYMLPDVFVNRTDLPFTGNGKIDRAGIRRIWDGLKERRSE